MNPAFLSSIHHDGSSRYVRTHGNKTLRIGDEVTLRLRTGVEAPVDWWYNGLGPQRHVPTDANDFRLLANYDAPIWKRVFLKSLLPSTFVHGFHGNHGKEPFYYGFFRDAAPSSGSQ